MVSNLSRNDSFREETPMLAKSSSSRNSELNSPDMFPFVKELQLDDLILRNQISRVSLGKNYNTNSGVLGSMVNEDILPSPPRAISKLYT